jgi:hypothetical protein
VAAAAYNAAWGLAAIVVPGKLARAFGFADEGAATGWRATGVMVLAYAPAYAWAAAHPREARPILATAAFGKSIGAVGWVAGLMTGRVPAADRAPAPAQRPALAPGPRRARQKERLISVRARDPTIR